MTVIAELQNHLFMVLLVSPVRICLRVCRRIPACSPGTFAFSGACGGIERCKTCFNCDRIEIPSCRGVARPGAISQSNGCSILGYFLYLHS